MKQNIKTIFVIMSFAFMLNIGNAQNSTKNTREMSQFGVKIGANLANVYDTEGEDFIANSKIGWAGGVFASIPIGAFLGIQPELLFSQKGYKGSGSFLGSEYKYSRTSNFIDLPIFVALKPTNSITILAGPQFSYLLKETNKFDNEFFSSEEEQEFDNDDVRKNILCMVGGFDMNYQQFVFGARIGIDLQNNKGDGTSTTPRYKNIWYQATVGFRLFSN